MCVCVFGCACLSVCLSACLRWCVYAHIQRSIKYIRCRSKRGSCHRCSVVPLLLTQTGTREMWVYSQMLSQTELFKYTPWMKSCHLALLKSIQLMTKTEAPHPLFREGLIHTYSHTFEGIADSDINRNPGSKVLD